MFVSSENWKFACLSLVFQYVMWPLKEIAAGRVILQIALKLSQQVDWMRWMQTWFVEMGIMLLNAILTFL